ncbi:MAG: EMC3/TMCO1 family protein [Candidatus Nanoarchaeia archaeon]
MVLNAILDPIFSPLLYLDPLLAIVIISFVISLGITFAYKKLTNQSLMRDLKSEIKEFQKEMKTLKDKPDEMMKVQKKAMETNTKYMMHSLKPTLFTFLPIIIIFSWLHAHMGYFPIVEGEEFTSTVFFDENVDGSITIKLPNGVELVKGDVTEEIANKKAEWVLKADQGEYSLKYEYEGETYERDLIVTSTKSDRMYANPEITSSDYNKLKESPIESLQLSNEKIRPLQKIPLVGSIPWVGNFGWLGTYIVFSIIFSISLRKLLKVY